MNSLQKIQTYYSSVQKRNVKKAQTTFNDRQNQVLSNAFDQLISKVYIINMDKDAHRMINAAKQMDKHNIEYERFPAVDGATLDIAGLVKQNVMKRQAIKLATQRPGSLGCYLSHLQLWLKIRDSADDVVLILEDDIHLTQNFKNDVVFYLAKIPKPWDIVYLGYNEVWGEKVNDYAIRPFTGNRQGYNSGMFGYIVNKETIANLINVCFPIVHPIKDPVIRANFDKLNAFYITKKIVTHVDDFESSRNQGNRFH